MVTLVQTIVDNFNDSSIGPNWSIYSSATTESGGWLRIQSNTGAGNLQGADWTPIVNLNNRYHGFKLLAAGTQQAQLETVPIQFSLTNGNAFYWSIQNGTASCVTVTGGGATKTTRGTTFAYNSSVHVYFAIGIIGGELTWAWSTNGIDFTIHTTLANPFTGTSAPLSTYANRETAGGSNTSIHLNDFSYWEASGSSVAAQPIGLSASLTVIGQLGKTAPASSTVGVTLSAEGQVSFGPNKPAAMPVGVAITTTHRKDGSGAGTRALGVAITATGAVGKAASASLALSAGPTGGGVSTQGASAGLSVGAAIAASGLAIISSPVSMATAVAITASGYIASGAGTNIRWLRINGAWVRVPPA